MKQAKRRGPAPREPKPGERVAMSLRVTPEVKGRLESAAADSGRSFSQEAEMRLEQGFRDEDLVARVLATAYGPQLAGLILIMARVMNEAGRTAGFNSSFTLEGMDAWCDSPYAFKQAAEAAHRVLQLATPPGEAKAPAAMSGAGLPANLASVIETARDYLGVGFANSAVEAVAGDGRTSELQRWAAPVRDLLGPSMVKRLSKARKG